MTEPSAATVKPMSLQALRSDMDRVLSPWCKALGLVLEAADERSATFSLPVSPALVHGGGVLCGQALMAAADSAMVIALASALGGFQPMTTVQLQTSFLSSVPAACGALAVRAVVLRKGRKLCFGEIEITKPDGTLVAHATTTYTLLSA